MFLATWLGKAEDVRVCHPTARLLTMGEVKANIISIAAPRCSAQSPALVSTCCSALTPAQQDTMAGGPDDLSSLLGRSGVLQDHLAPKLTICQLLLVSQVCRQYRHSLRHDDVWRSAVRRSLPPEYPLTHSSTAGYRQTAYEFGRIQCSNKAGSAVLRCGIVPRCPCL